MPPEPHGQLSPLPVLLIKAVPLSETDAGPSRGISIDLFENLERKRVLGNVVVPTRHDDVDRRAPSRPSHQWMLRVAAFCIDVQVAQELSPDR